MNFVLLTIDTVRPDRLGCYGYKRATPRIDSLSKNGITFEQAITNGTYTKAAFPPLLSSTYASMYGGPFHEVSAGRPMLAPLLRDHGYRTAGFTSNPLLGANVGYDTGFDVFQEPVPSPDDRGWIEWKGVQRLLSSPRANRLLMGFGLDTSPPPIYVEGQEITEPGIEWLESGDSPFFLWLHYMDAHWPYHDQHALTDPDERARAWADRRLMSNSRRTIPREEMLRRLDSLYDASIQRLDQQLGQIIDAVSGAQSSEETAIILVADHGEAFYEHDRWQHGAVFDFHEEILRVPLIIKAPGTRPGLRVDQMVSLIDVPPTILDLAGIEIPPEMEGQTLLPVIEGSGEPKPQVICEMVDMDWYCVAVRTERYKYVFDERRPSVRQLFDLVADPTEDSDLFGNEPQVEFDLEVRLQQHLERIREAGARDEQGGWQVEGDVVRRLRSLGYID